MHSQKFSILGGAMVEKNHFFRIQDQVTKVSCCAEYCTSLCAVLSLIPSINQEKKIKTDHVMHLQKFSILDGPIVEKNHFFRIQDQVTKVSCCAEYCTSLCAVLSLIPSINHD